MGLNVSTGSFTGEGVANEAAAPSSSLVETGNDVVAPEPGLKDTASSLIETTSNAIQKLDVDTVWKELREFIITGLISGNVVKGKDHDPFGAGKVDLPDLALPHIYIPQAIIDRLKNLFNLFKAAVKKVGSWLSVLDRHVRILVESIGSSLSLGYLETFVYDYEPGETLSPKHQERAKRVEDKLGVAGLKHYGIVNAGGSYRKEFSGPVDEAIEFLGQMIALFYGVGIKGLALVAALYRIISKVRIKDIPKLLGNAQGFINKLVKGAKATGTVAVGVAQMNKTEIALLSTWVASKAAPTSETLRKVVGGAKDLSWEALSKALNTKFSTLALDFSKGAADKVLKYAAEGGVAFGAAKVVIESWDDGDKITPEDKTELAAWYAYSWVLSRLFGDSIEVIRRTVAKVRGKKFNQTTAKKALDFIIAEILGGGAYYVSVVESGDDPDVMMEKLTEKALEDMGESGEDSDIPPPGTLLMDEAGKNWFEVKDEENAVWVRGTKSASGRTYTPSHTMYPMRIQDGKLVVGGYSVKEADSLPSTGKNIGGLISGAPQVRTMNNGGLIVM